MRLIWVRWIDSVEVHGWQILADAEPPAPAAVETVGWEVRRTDTDIVVAGSLTQDDMPQVCGTMVIPMESVRQVRYLDAQTSASEGDG